MEILKVRMVAQPVKIRAEFNLICITFEGIEAIKYALLEGEKVSTPEMQIKYRVIASPLYECNIVTVNKREGIELMGNSLRAVEKAIKEKHGTFALIMSPYVLGEQENEKSKRKFSDVAEKNEENEDEEDEESNENA